MSSIKKVILSHKRADSIITHLAISNCVVCIPESQLEEYKKFHPKLEYITHPDSVKGLSPKRQWVYEKFGDVFMLDDDIELLANVYHTDRKNVRYVLTASEASDIIDDVYNTAKEVGVNFFGFNRSGNPVSYSGSTPIKLTGFITGGAFGIMAGSKISFPDYWDFVGEDYWVNALNAHYHRKCYIEYRFAFNFRETEKGKGGVADYRTEEKRKETYLFLKKNFGSAIKLKIPRPAKKSIMKYEKSLVTPF